MAVLPLQLARVSNNLRTSLAQRSIARTQQSLLNVQNQLASGKKLNTPSDDPGDAAVSMQLRSTLEKRLAYAKNLEFSGSQLGEVDSTLSSLNDLVKEAYSIAHANVGLVTPEERAQAAEIVQRLYDQAVTLGNRQFRGMYLFAGDRGDQPPFISELGGVKFVGTDRVLGSSVDETTSLPYMVNGNELFGALSTRVQGKMDISPRLTLETRILDLRGAGGEGVQLGAILLGDGTSQGMVDLTTADTIGDVIDTINASGIGSITASLAADGNSLLLTSGSGSITVNEVGGGRTARQLGILSPTGAGLSLDGESVQPLLSPITRLQDVRGGAGLDSAGLIITNGQKTATIDLSSLNPATATVQDLLNAINSAGVGVLGRINASGTGIDVINTVQGTSMRIAENGGATAAQLGIRSFAPDSPLSELNSGQGIRTSAGADIRITRHDGTTFDVDLDGLNTVQDVIDAINAAAGSAVASFATTGNGIVLTDSTAGATAFSVTALNNSLAAADLGITGSTAGNTITGQDVNAVEAPGLFANLARLREALINSDQGAITAAAEALDADRQRIVSIQGRVGAQVQELESRQQRLEDQNLAAQALLSRLEDLDYNQAIPQFTSLQMALQANLMTAGKVLNLSLLDFLQ